MNQQFQQKVAFLNELGTDKLINEIKNQEYLLDKLIREDHIYRRENSRLIASYGEDCAEVKSIIANMLAEPPVNPDGKKVTQAQLDLWVRQQRDKYEPLVSAIKKQNQVFFQAETNRINMDMAKKKLESLRGVMALRTAQIRFLTDGE